MGYTVHHAIVISSWDAETLERVHNKALELFPAQEVCRSISRANGVSTILVGPDGSKAGWHHSDEGDSGREKLKEFLRTLAYEDGSSPAEWAEIQYGDEAGDNRMLDHSETQRVLCECGAFSCLCPRK